MGILENPMFMVLAAKKGHFKSLNSSLDHGHLKHENFRKIFIKISLNATSGVFTFSIANILFSAL